MIMSYLSNHDTVFRIFLAMNSYMTDLSYCWKENVIFSSV